MKNSAKPFIPKTFPTNVQLTAFKYVRFTLKKKNSPSRYGFIALTGHLYYIELVY